MSSGSQSSLSKPDDWRLIRPEDVLKLTAPTQGFLCPLNTDLYEIEFLTFKIRNAETDDVLFQIRRSPEASSPSRAARAKKEAGPQNPPMDDTPHRTIRYSFGPHFLDLRCIGTSLQFSVGDKALENFRMIERHYLRDTLIKSYDFNMPFCMPGSTNEWEVMYDMPELSKERRDDLINAPWQSRSDSFYFVNDTLIMHNKAEYSYATQS